MLLAMSTYDTRIDRRILLEAGSLKEAGWDLIILGRRGMNLPFREEYRGIPIVRLEENSSSREYLKFQKKISAIDSLFSWHNRLFKGLLGMEIRDFPRRFVKEELWQEIITLSPFEYQVFSQLHQMKPRSIHAHDLPVLKPSLLASLLLKVPLVYDAHELFYAQTFPDPRQQLKFFHLEKTLIPYPQAVITVNRYIAQEMAGLYRIPEPRVILNCTDFPAGFEPGKRYHKFARLAGENKKIVLYQGGWLENRNLENLIASAAYFKPNTILVLLGYGFNQEYIAGLHKLAQDLGVADRVFFHPAVGQEELLFYTASADLGVIPYRGEDLNTRYASPNKLFEYIAAGLPFLANDLVFFREICEKYRCGKIIDFSHPELLSREIQNLLEDREALEELKANTVLAAQTLCWEKEAVKLREIYRSLPNMPENNMIES